MKPSEFTMLVGTIWLAPHVPEWAGVAFGCTLAALSLAARFYEARK